MIYIWKIRNARACGFLTCTCTVLPWKVVWYSFNRLGTLLQHLTSLIFEAAGSRTAKGNQGSVFWARCTPDISWLFIWLSKAPACTCKCRRDARLGVWSWALLTVNLTFSLMSLWRFIQFVQFNLPSPPSQKCPQTLKSAHCCKIIACYDTERLQKQMWTRYEGRVTDGISLRSDWIC